MMRTHTFDLRAHPATPAGFVQTLEVTLHAGSDGALHFIYSLQGDLSHLEIPAPATAQRKDELWRRTCFEAFLRPAGKQAYLELNFSPSTEWAAYSFNGYRKDMMAATLAPEPSIVCEHDSHRLTLETRLALGQPFEAHLQLALSAVLRERSGKISYWALRHAPDKPDFHHDASFAATLDGAL
jgi:hypothetical protein